MDGVNIVAVSEALVNHESQSVVMDGLDGDTNAIEVKEVSLSDYFESLESDVNHDLATAKVVVEYLERSSNKERQARLPLYLNAKRTIVKNSIERTHKLMQDVDYCDIENDTVLAMVVAEHFEKNAHERVKHLSLYLKAKAIVKHQQIEFAKKKQLEESNNLRRIPLYMRFGVSFNRFFKWLDQPQNIFLMIAIVWLAFFLIG